MERYTLIKAKGGLGNRMLCAGSGILWSRLAGRVPVVDWRDGAYADKGVNAFPRLFVNSGGEIDQIPESGSVRPGLWDGKLDTPVVTLISEMGEKYHSSPTVHRRLSVRPRDLNVREDTAVFWHYTGQFEALLPVARKRDEYRQLGLLGLIGRVLNEEMPPAPEIASKIEDARRQLFGEHPHVVGVHVRQTDRAVRTDVIIDRVKEIVARKPGAAVFLATDKRSVEDTFRELFGSVLVTEKWYPDDGAVMHQNPDCPDRHANAVEAMLDMYLLSACDSLVYSSRSTFGLLADALGESRQREVHDIDRRSREVMIRKIIKRVCA